MSKVGARIAVAKVDELPTSMGKTVFIEDRQLAVFKLSNGEIRAIDNLCPHKQGQLSQGIVCDEFVFCPLHDWKIDTNDGKVQDPDTGCVQTYKTEIEDGYVYVIL